MVICICLTIIKIYSRPTGLERKRDTIRNEILCYSQRFRLIIHEHHYSAVPVLIGLYSRADNILGLLIY